MCYVLTIKDHFSKYLWLRPISEKKSELVAAELRNLFYEIGFPLIFHTDNGTEFIAKTVFDLLKRDPLVFSVTGRVRTPTDQGSVERSNQDIRKGISKCILQGHQNGEVLTWVDVLSKVANGLNNSSTKKNISSGNVCLVPSQMHFCSISITIA